jgi:3-methyladenine DNA glycosylase AlkD
MTSPAADRVGEALAWLKSKGSTRVREQMAGFGIPPGKAYGVPMAAMQQLAKRLGHDHTLAAALWATGQYEARIVAAYVDEPGRVTPGQMDRWCRAFDNWGICDTVCFVLFDRTPFAFAKVTQWSRRREEFVKRAAFALLASLALHDKAAADRKFSACLPLIERAATDERNFVKKGVSWALRSVGRRNPALNAEAVEVARRLSASAEAAPRWVGKDALRELTSAAMKKRFQSRPA